MYMWSIRKPSHDELFRFVNRHRNGEFSYSDIGRVAELHPRGFDLDERREVVGRGERAFELAKQVFREWAQFPKPWTCIFPLAASIHEGITLAMLARAYGVWWANACRIVYVIDEPRCFGFAYGTLTEHVERGEEQFLIELLADESVCYDIRSFSRPRILAAKIAYPLARRMQRRFVRESFQLLRRRLNDA